MKIGDIQLSSNALLAPIAGASDIGFRYLAREFKAGLTYTEMISAKGLLYKNKLTEQLTTLASNEKPSAVQLFGHCPEDIFSAIKIPCIQKFDIIDINMGCPVNKIVKNGEGSALMKNPSLAKEIIIAAKQAGKGKLVTAKIRAGFERETAAEFAYALEEAGVAAVTVHARLREQFYMGEADWQVIKRVKEAVKIPVIGNGDIKTSMDINKMIEATDCNGVMIARGALGRPWIFAEYLGENPIIDIYEIISKHIEQLCSVYEEKIVINLMKSHLCHYTKGKRGSRILREKIALVNSIKSVLETACELKLQEDI